MPHVESPSDPVPSQTELALRAQRGDWKVITERVTHKECRELPHQVPRRILFFGVGSSLHVAHLSAWALRRDRTRVRIPIVAVSSRAVGEDFIPQKGDWAIGISHRGRTEATSQAMDVCAREGAFCFQVSGRDAPRMPGAHFFLETVEQEVVEPHTRSVTGAICAITSLLLGNRALEEWEAIRSMGDPSLESCLEIFDRVPAPNVFVGEWEGEWIAREAALKFMEMARWPTRVYGTEEFFHGPRQAGMGEAALVEPAFVNRVWAVEHASDTRARELRAPRGFSFLGTTPLSFMPKLVELQWMALALALKRGINPDDLGKT